MGLFQIVVTWVADVDYVRDSERLYHLAVFCMLPLAQVDFLWEHLIAELLRDCPKSKVHSPKHMQVKEVQRSAGCRFSLTAVVECVWSCCQARSEGTLLRSIRSPLSWCRLLAHVPFSKPWREAVYSWVTVSPFCLHHLRIMTQLLQSSLSFQRLTTSSGTSRSISSTGKVWCRWSAFCASWTYRSGTCPSREKYLSRVALPYSPSLCKCPPGSFQLISWQTYRVNIH